MSDTSDKSQSPILLVEDNPTDVMMTREALEENSITRDLHVVEDGIKALEYLKAASTLPSLILLDLNLPRMSGRELLQTLKTHDTFKSIPVVVLTTSNAEIDIGNAYSLSANCYITKPVDFTDFVEIIRSLNEFWFRCATLPNAENSTDGF